MIPLFSIGITTYDRVDLLIETLSSVTSQSFSDLEIIIGNDNPNRVLTAESLGFDDARIRIVNHATNLGELNNMNELLRLSTGRYFTWLADDDVYDPNLLATVASALDKFDYPNVVYTSFKDFEGKAVPTSELVSDDAVQLLSGGDFIGGYLRDQIKAIGVMGFFETNYLRGLGGLEDVSGDGMGFYCEYMILIRSALQERIGYINAPMVFYRVHEGAWGIQNSNLEQYDRAARNLLTAGAQVFATKQLQRDFRVNMRQLLKRVMIQYINVARTSQGASVTAILSYLTNVRSYITRKVGRKFYWKAVVALIEAELWILLILMWRKFLSSAPSQVISSAYFLQSLVSGKRTADGNVTPASH